MTASCFRSTSPLRLRCFFNLLVLCGACLSLASHDSEKNMYQTSKNRIENGCYPYRSPPSRVRAVPPSSGVIWGDTIRAAIVLFLLLPALVTTQACSVSTPPTQEALQTAVVAALDTLVTELVAERPVNAAAYTERLRAYLDAHPAFYGSAAALLDRAGTVTTKPLRLSHR